MCCQVGPTCGRNFDQNTVKWMPIIPQTTHLPINQMLSGRDADYTLAEPAEAFFKYLCPHNSLTDYTRAQIIQGGLKSFDWEFSRIIKWPKIMTEANVWDRVQENALKRPPQMFIDIPYNILVIIWLVKISEKFENFPNSRLLAEIPGYSRHENVNLKIPGFSWNSRPCRNTVRMNVWGSKYPQTGDSRELQITTTWDSFLAYTRKMIHVPATGYMYIW